MIGRILAIGEWAILQELSKGRRRISELRQVVPLYGSALDLAISDLLVTGLVRRVTEGGEEYLELTELGKNITTAPWPWGPWGWGRAWGPWGAGPRWGRHRWAWW